MTVVEAVLAILRSHFPDLEVDERGGERRPREPRPGRSRHRRGEERRGEQRRPAPDPRLARCYAELGVPYGADLWQVREAWRRLMRQHHPDLHGDDAERQRLGTEQVKRFNQAFEEIGRRLREGTGGMTHA